MNLNWEKRFWKKEFKRVAGLDESGRGPLCGPVVAAAVLLNLRFKISDLRFLKGIKDSKKLTPKRREKFYQILTKNPQIEWGIGRVSEKVIDKINILEATKLAMTKALKNLEKKHRFLKMTDRSLLGYVDFLILDGNFKIDLDIPQKPIVKADEKVFSCAAASIIAKVTRDRIMQNYHKKFPRYGFDKHKGYPTKLHLKMLKKYGLCKIHRRTFGPVKRTIEKF